MPNLPYLAAFFQPIFFKEMSKPKAKPPLPILKEGEILYLPTMDYDGDLAFCRVEHFGGWLRLAGEVPEGASVTVIVYLVLKE